MIKKYDLNWLKEKVDSEDIVEFDFFYGHENNNKNEVGKFCFSQWYESPFTVNSITYKTAEHWMMAHKALLFNDKNKYHDILNCNKPSKAKALGQQIKGYDERIWDSNKLNIVIIGNIHKFNQYPKFADYLLKTKNKILVEASPTDKIWGIGLSLENKEIYTINAWNGKNMLGFALMSARDFLMEFGHFEPLENIFIAPWNKLSNTAKNPNLRLSEKFGGYEKKFNEYYQNLSPRNKIIYKLFNPIIFEWEDFSN